MSLVNKEAGLVGDAKPWWEVQQFTMNHILFGGKLPAFLGVQPVKAPDLYRES